jgi:myo-inositol-1(or 4)-monophosphatase
MTDPGDIAARFDFAKGLARAAGDLAHGYFLGRAALTIKSKGLQDMASEADLETELLVKREIAAAWPGDAFLGEETGMTDFAPAQGIWVVDPIDGTQPFVSGMSSWCVSIAYLAGGEVRFGVVYAPARDELFAGGIGFPATLNGAPVERHAGRTLKEGIVALGYSPRVAPDVMVPIFDRLLRAGGMYYRDGSGALCLCYVAAGRLLGYIEPHINAWDCLGAIAVIRAAGHRTSDFLAGDGLRRGNPLVAGTEAVFPELVAVLEGGDAPDLR